MKTNRFVFLTLLVILTLCSYLWLRNIIAGEAMPKGTLTEMTGTVEILKSGEEVWLPAAENIPLTQGDRVKTGSDSAAEITLDNGTIIKIEEDADLTLMLLLYAKEQEETKLHLTKGKAITNVRKDKKGLSKTSIRTLNCVASVRGTEFVVAAGDGNTNIGVFSGEVGVVNVNDAGDETGTGVSVQPDQETKAQLGSEPSAPYAMTAAMAVYRERVKKLAQRAEFNRKRMQHLMKEREKTNRQIIQKWTKIRDERINRLLKDRKGQIKNADKLYRERKVPRR